MHFLTAMSTIAGIRKDAKAEGRTEGVAIGETRTNEKLVRMMLQDHKDIREIHKIYWYVSCALFV